MTIYDGQIPHFDSEMFTSSRNHEGLDNGHGVDLNLLTRSYYA